MRGLDYYNRTVFEYIDQNAELSFLSVVQSPEIYLPIIGFFIILIGAFIVKRIFFK